MVIHVVKKGDSIYSIAKAYGVSPYKIIKENEVENPTKLVIGQTLVITGEKDLHIVEEGESVYSIAKIYGVPVEEIVKQNPQLQNNKMIYPGQAIMLPVKDKKIKTIRVNGYAFPNTKKEVLLKTLPNLTYVSIFSYKINADGSFASVPNDEEIIRMAKEVKTAPIMVVSNIEEQGGFSSKLVSDLLNNDAAQENLINNIIDTMKKKGYYGIDVDFEYLFPKDREKYNNFLRKLVARAKPLGYEVSTALAPKTSADQKGILYEAHDYDAQGKIVDHSVLMTYEWGYTYGEPMAVAPLNQVRKVLDYAVTAMPRNKILMGMPNYGYDWTLPYVKGTAAKSLSNKKAVQQASEKGAIIKYDKIAQSPYYNYYDENKKEHVVWFEDARSILAKLETAAEYDLSGVSYWTIGKYCPQNWLILNSLFNVEKLL